MLTYSLLVDRENFWTILYAMSSFEQVRTMPPPPPALQRHGSQDHTLKQHTAALLTHLPLDR